MKFYSSILFHKDGNTQCNVLLNVSMKESSDSWSADATGNATGPAGNFHFSPIKMLLVCSMSILIRK